MSSAFNAETVQINIDAGEVARVVSTDVVQAVQRAGTAVVGFARIDLTSKGIGRTGDLAQQIETQTEVRGDQVVGTVTSKARNREGVPYGIFVHEGTTGPIRPRRTRALRFRSGGQFVFAANVQGTRETGNFTPFLQNGLDRLTPADFG